MAIEAAPSGERLLEREEELDALRVALPPGGPADGAVVLLEGSPGIGKTSLLDSARGIATEQAWRVVSARGAELEREFAFGGLRQLYGPLLDGTVDPQAASLFRPGQLEASAGSAHAVFSALYWWLVRLADRAPVLVAVDDASWLDVESLRFLGFLARRLDGIPVVVVVATRLPDAEPAWELLQDLRAAPRVLRLAPPRLTEEAVRALVSAEFGVEGAEPFVRACWRTSEGNPLFVRELLRLLRSEGVAPVSASVPVVERLVPRALAAHVRSRLARQNAAVRRVAEAAAVLGPQAPLRLVTDLAGVASGQARDALDQLSRLDLVEVGDQGEVSFRHPVLAAAVEAGLSPGDRVRAHERAAGLLAVAGATLERQASHLLQVPPAGDQRHVGVLVAAAVEARRRGAPESAGVYLRRALREPPPPHGPSELNRQLGNCEAYTARFADAEHHLREAVDTASTPQEQVMAGYSLARLLEALARPEDATRELRRTLDALPADASPALRIWCEAELAGYSRVVLGERAQAQVSLTALAGHSAADWAPLPDVIAAHAAFELMLRGGPPSQVAAGAERALAAGRLSPDRSALYIAVQALISAGGLEAARQHLGRTLAQAEEAGLWAGISLCRAYLALAALWAGNLPEVAYQVELGAQAMGTADHAAVLVLGCRIELTLERGELAAARRLADDAPPGGQAVDSCLGFALLMARGRVALADGDPLGAASLFARVGELYRRWHAEQMVDHPWRAGTALALAAAGQSREAESVASEHLLLARTAGDVRALGHALRVAATVTVDAESALALADEAVRVLTPSAARLELAHALATAGRLHLDTGRRASGRDHLRRSMELADRCGASALVGTVRRWLVSAGGRPPRLRSRGLDALTPAEQRVARLVADQRSNREIARTLFITEKTVEGHLSRTFRKMGVTSREELAAALPPEVGDF